MQGISPDRTQTLEVMGTQAFEDFVRQLETEGVGIKTTNTPPAPPVKIEPVAEKAKYDIGIPITRPIYTHDYKKLADFSLNALEPLYDQSELEEVYRIRLKMEFATTETEVHQEDVAAGPAPLTQDILASITNKTIACANLPSGFAGTVSNRSANTLPDVVLAKRSTSKTARFATISAPCWSKKALRNIWLARLAS